LIDERHQELHSLRENGEQLPGAVPTYVSSTGGACFW